MQTLGLHFFVQRDIKQGRSIRNIRIKSEDKNLPVATSTFSSHFILFPGLKGSFTAIMKEIHYLPGFCVQTHSMSMLKLLKQLNPNKHKVGNNNRCQNKAVH